MHIILVIVLCIFFPVILEFIIVKIMFVMALAIAVICFAAVAGALVLIAQALGFWAATSPNFVTIFWITSPLWLLLAAYAYAYSAEIDEFIQTRINH